MLLTFIDVNASETMNKLFEDYFVMIAPFRMEQFFLDYVNGFFLCYTMSLKGL